MKKILTFTLCFLAFFTLIGCDNGSETKEETPVYDLSTIVFEDTTVEYDGKPHSILVENLPDGLKVEYDGNEKVEIGEYTVKATIKYSTGETCTTLSAILKIVEGESDALSKYSDDLFINGSFTYHAVGGFVMDWEPTETNTMTPASIRDVAEFSTDVADYLVAKNEEYTKKDKTGIKALYFIKNYELNNQPENASMAPALVKDLEAFGLVASDIPAENVFEQGYLVALNQGYAVKCIRAYYDDVDENYINDRWISDPRVAHTESLTPDTLFMPKWVETPTEGEEHLGKWDDNPMCITGPGLYTVVVVEYNVVGTSDTPGFGLALFKQEGKLDDSSDNPSDEKTPTPTVPSIDISMVEFNDLTVDYTGESFEITCKNLPEGVIVTYLMNKQTEPGEYLAYAIISDEKTLAEIGRLTAVLTIIPGKEPTPEVDPIPLSGFHLVINGTTYVALTSNGAAQDPSFTEYYAMGVVFNVGDIVTLYNADTGDSWAIQTPDQYSAGSWTGSASGITCNTAGTYDVYVKMKFNEDQIYFGPAQ